jgi:hypothetical protein
MILKGHYHVHKISLQVSTMRKVNQVLSRRMASSGMLRRVALVRTDVSEELSASFIRVTRISELGKTLAVTSNRRTLRRILSSAGTSVLKRATRRNIPEDAVLHSHRRENLKSYKVLSTLPFLKYILILPT